MTLYKELPPFSSATTAAAAASISSQETFLSLSLSTLPRLNPSPVHWLVHSSLEILPSSSSSQLLNFSRTCLISNRSRPCPYPDAEKRKKQMRLWLWGDVIKSVGLGARVKLKLSIGWTPFPVDFYPNCGCLLKGGHQAGTGLMCTQPCSIIDIVGNVLVLVMCLFLLPSGWKHQFIA